MERNMVVHFPNGQDVPVLLFPDLMQKCRDFLKIHGKGTAVVVSSPDAEDAYKAALARMESGWTIEAVNAPNMEEFSGVDRFRILLVNKQDIIPVEFTVKGARA